MVRSSPSPAAPALLQVVAEPRRWELLEHLTEGDRKVGELVARTGRPQNAVSYHLGELRAAGLVSARRSSADGRDTYYRVHLDRFGTLLGSAAAALDPSLSVRSSGPPPPDRLAGRGLRVLFLCTGNSARSQMAEALLVHRSHGTVRASSAGSHPKPLHPLAVATMAEHGIDIAGHRPKHLDEVARHRFHRTVTLCDKVRERCPELPGAEPPLHWSMADPSATEGSDQAVAAAFAATATELIERVDALLTRLAHQPQEDHRVR